MQDRKKIKFLETGIRVFLCVLIIGVVFLPYFVVKSATTTATLTVTNSAPAASNISVTNAVAGTVTLTAGTTTTTTVTFTVTDNNGCEDIDSASPDTTVVFYRTNVAGGSGCTPDNANCYTMSCGQDGGSCTAGGADLNATYTCTANIQFYADPTDAGSTYAATTWTAGVIPADNAGAASANTDTTVEIASTTSHTITASINYSSLALGANTGTSDQTTTVTNKGNRAIDVQVGGYGTSTSDGYSMSCTIGDIDVAYEKFDTSASTAYASKTALQSDASPNTVSTNIAQGASSTGNIYWGMGLPATGVGGSCSGTIVSTAVNH